MPLSLVADCASCAGLCCVALPYQRSADFPRSKAADTPCPLLATDGGFACTIHDRLADGGWHGCLAFDCAGAGPHVTAAFAGSTWREAPALAAEQFAAFRALLPAFEVASYVGEALALSAPGEAVADPVRHAALTHVARLVEDAVCAPNDQLGQIDVASLRAAAGPPLRATAAAVRHLARPGRTARAVSARAPGADLAGRDLRGADLRGADLSGALLLGADLRGADLRRATLLGADLRGARLGGVRLEGAVFVPRRVGR